MRTVLFFVGLFVAFGVGTTAGYSMISSKQADRILVANNTLRDALYNNVYLRGVIAQVNVQDHTLIFEVPDQFSPLSKARLLVNYGTQGFAPLPGATDSRPITESSVGSAVRIAIKHAPGAFIPTFIALIPKRT